MKTCLFILLLSCFIVSCSSTKTAQKSNSKNSTILTSDNDGLSYEKAIVITETTESKGVSAEYAWIREHFPGSALNGQALSQPKGKPYDIITITTKNGEKKSIYFDISRFYGRF